MKAEKICKNMHIIDILEENIYIIETVEDGLL